MSATQRFFLNKEGLVSMLTRPSLFGFLLSRHPSAAPFLSRFSPPLLPTHNLDEVLSSLPRGVWSIWTRRNEGFYRYCFDRLLREERLSARGGPHCLDREQWFFSLFFSSSGCLQESFLVITLRGYPVQTAVRPGLVVKVDPSADAGAGFRAGFVCVQVDVFVFE
jgi:hypothetical protein